MTVHGDELRPLRETGVDLDDSALVGGYDLDRVRAAVDARTGPSGGGGGNGLVLPAAGAAALVLLALGGWWATRPAIAPVIAVDAVPVPGAAAPVAASRAGGPVAPVRPPEVTAPPRVMPPTPVAAPAVRVASDDGSGQAEEPPAARSAAPLAEGTAAPEPPGRGDLAEQNALFAAGEAALAGGDHAAAGEAFGAYLERWPDGVFRDDALVATLDLAIRAGAWATAEELAGQLALVPSLASRREALVRARAEALVHLGRCDEAIAVAEGLSRADAGAIRRGCRQGGDR